MLNVGIIGSGGISRAHVSAYREFPQDVRICALVDTDPSALTAAQDEQGLHEARTYTDVQAMLASESLDLVSIATPPATHRPLCIATLGAGVHTIVEKPMAPSLEDCDAMLAAQRSSGKLLSVIAQNRFRDDMTVLKATLDSGLLGPLSHTHIASQWWRSLSYYDLWWRGTWESEGGGCTLNHAIHHIDLALWLLGRPQAVAAMMTNAQHDNAEVEDLSVAIWQYERSLAELTSSVVHHGQEQSIQIQGSRARIGQPWGTVAESGRPNGFPTAEGDAELVHEIDALAAAVPKLAHTGHAGQIGDVIAAVRDGREPAIDGTDGRNAVELVTAIYCSAIERRTVDLPILGQDPYYRAGTLETRAPRFFRKSASVASFDGAIDVGTTQPDPNIDREDPR